MQEDHPLPEIRINFSPLLYFGECQILAERFKKTCELQSPEQYHKITAAYREAWQPYEIEILTGMTQALGVSFYRSVIDVTLAPFFRGKSTPLIISFRSSPDKFVDVLTHELLHILQTDNNKYQAASYIKNKDPIDEWRHLFGEHDRSTLVHIPVHALHKYLYLDVLRAPERFRRDVEDASSSKIGGPYARAWEYVNKHDYNAIIADLRKIYC